MATGTYRVVERKCATCRYWDGGRSLVFVKNRAHYVKADAGQHACLAQSSKRTTAATTCPKYQPWEKLG